MLVALEDALSERTRARLVAMLALDPDVEPTHFRNYYECNNCQIAWGEVWSAQCDSNCPGCDVVYTVAGSVDLYELPEEDEQ